MTLSRYQQDKISEYKIWLTICFENAQNILLCLYVSSLSDKFDTIVLLPLIASCASSVASFFTNYSTLLINDIKKIQQRKILNSLLLNYR